MRKILVIIFSLLAVAFGSADVAAQGVTTASMTGMITDAKGEGLPGATVQALHTPSGTKYGTVTQPDGRFNIPGMRVGGPYTVTVTFVGYSEQKVENINLTLGTSTDLNFVLQDESQTLGEVEIISSRNSVINSERTGASTNISNEQITRMPTISRSFADLTRMTPQAGSNNSFGGRNGTFNNITIDGALFNNAFGLQPTIGSQTNAQPISLDAIEQIQVNIAPYDVRQGGFTGAGINAVTRSGTNEFSGSVFTFRRNEALLGRKVGNITVPKQDFFVNQTGFRLGGPILKNKLFFFINGEIERRETPHSSFVANRPGLPAPGPNSNTSAANASTLDSLRSHLIDTYGYDPGPYENFSLRNYSDKATAKLDWNINDKHKFSIKYNYLKSFADIAPSPSGSIGSGRAPGATSMPFRSAYYVIHNNLNSVIAELNSRFSNKISNNLTIGFTAMRDFRESSSGAFPMVDIGNGAGQPLTSFGYEPFSANNKLDSDVLQISDNLTIYQGKHTITVGTYNEFYKFKNGFAPFYYGGYQFPTLAAFYSGVPSRYELRYSAVPGGEFPFAEISAFQIGVYAQDEFAVRNNLNLTFGVRADIPVITSDILKNPALDTLKFRDGQQIDVSRVPEVSVLWSPRVGFNWDVKGDKTTQVRGGTGIFTGRVPYVWISNQASNTGMLFGSFAATGANAAPYRFSPDVTKYTPATATASSSYNLAVTDRNFKFPQVWRSNLAIDKQLPGGFVATLEAIYTKDLNAVYLENINLPNAPKDVTAGGKDKKGADQRPVWSNDPAGSSVNQNLARINPNISDAILLKNTSQGYSYNVTAQLQKNFGKSLFASVAYTYSDAKSVNDGGTQAQSMWRDRAISGDPNAQALSPSEFLTRHRFIGSVSYRKEYAGFAATSVSLFYEAAPAGRYSYVYTGDLNRDYSNGNNDLMYIPRNRGEIILQDISVVTGGQVTHVYTAEEQWNDLDRFISQDRYLRERRGGYAERNGAEQPWFAKLDVSVKQDFFVKVKGKTNTIQLSFDIFNFGNLINKDWGIIKTPLRRDLLRFMNYNAQGLPVFTMPYLAGTRNPVANSFQQSSGLGSRWVAQFGIRYIFN